MGLVLPLCGVFAILKNKKVYFQYIFAHCFTSKLRKIKRKDKDLKKTYYLILRKMIHVGLELTTPDSTGQCDNHCATQNSKLSVYLSYLLTTNIYNKFEHGQNCVNAIGTPCLSANIVNTQGVPIGVKASTVRTS